jgi:hypothetical protein
VAEQVRAAEGVAVEVVDRDDLVLVDEPPCSVVPRTQRPR